jgi:hypothetical protein
VLILEEHFKPEELKDLRATLERNGCSETDSIFQAQLVVTKLTQEKRIRRELNELVKQGAASGQSTKTIDIVKEKWIRQCLVEGKLLDWPFHNSTWRMVRIPAMQQVSPPKRQLSPGKFVVPGTPPSKRARTFNRAGSGSSAQGRRPSFHSDPSFESASSEDPSSKRFCASVASLTQSSGEEDERFDYRDIYSCRRKSPLICRNERFVNLLMEIKLARELSL